MAALTRPWIADRFIEYFSGEYDEPRAFFATDPDIKAAFGYSPGAWGQLADVFNTWGWMRQRGIAIARPEMGNKTSISALTEMVYLKAQAAGGAGAMMPAAAAAKKAVTKKPAAKKKTAKKAVKKKAAKKKPPK